MAEREGQDSIRIEGIEPWILLLLTEKYCSRVKVENALGIVPVILFEPNVKNVRFVNTE